MHDPRDPDDLDVEYETTHADSVLGYGGVVLGIDGVLHAMPEHEALAAAIPRWVELPAHEADTLNACLHFAGHDHPAVRAACAAGFGDLARRYGRLAQRARVVRAVQLGLRDRDHDVRGAAARSADILEHTLGWPISRPSSNG